MPEVVQSLQNNGLSPVTREQGEAVRAANNFKHYFECSTSSLEGIHDTIDHAFYAGMEANPRNNFLNPLNLGSQLSGVNSPANL
ncbi:hypothetical protein TNIN_157581 [Trichonephila inaurata madagascariensis]|uniref:Uncharacterized protein n=1 Tax=Trichonephila inaurata madagascariensis TaxID=2747483 RepID=A0A8X6XZR9_9ARAC|nr:hypothetical protein TNIN_157581 [Trichonephila inaurata madagascariensis]